MSAVETAIRQALKGHLYSLQWDESGCKVVDLKAKSNTVPPPPLKIKIPCAPPPDRVAAEGWTDKELTRLIELKRIGLTLNQMSMELNKDPDAIWKKWQRRAEWRDLVPVPRTTEPGLHEIVEAVCAATGVSGNDFKSHRRKVSYCKARQVYYWLAKKLTAKSFPQIGKHAGNRDHATVMHGIAKIERTRADHAAVIAAVLADLQIDPAKLEGQG